MNVDDLWVVEECETCGDEHYAYPLQDEPPNTVCTPTNGGQSQADNLSTPAAICG